MNAQLVAQHNIRNKAETKYLFITLNSLEATVKKKGFLSWNMASIDIYSSILGKIVRLKTLEGKRVWAIKKPNRQSVPKKV